MAWGNGGEAQALAHHAVQDQRKETDTRVRPDPLGQTVEHQRDPDLGLEYPEPVLDVVSVSPMVDCFGGVVVSWTIRLRPDAELVNTMLDAPIQTVATSRERPVVHSDRGAPLPVARMAVMDRGREACSLEVSQGRACGRLSDRGISILRCHAI
jgi:transposase InsO family protein